MALVAYILERDHWTCWRCGNAGADTGGHVLSYHTHPHLALDPDNLRAEHGKRRTIAADGYDCRGNYSYGNDTGKPSNQDAATSNPRRDWLGS